MASYQELEVWKLGISLVKEIYKITDKFPAKEKFRLCDQLCRATVSIPSNIAEGSARKSTRDFMRYVAIALGSLAEVRTQLIISLELEYIKKEEMDIVFNLCEVTGRKLQSLYSALERKK